MMQSSNIAVLATIFVFAAVFAQAAYSLSYDTQQRSKRLFWVDKKSDEDSLPDKRLFWVDKKTPEKRLFWVDKKTPEKRLFWVDKKDDDSVQVQVTHINKIADCMIKVVAEYGKHIQAECKQPGVNTETCVEQLNVKRAEANMNCLYDYEGGQP